MSQTEDVDVSLSVTDKTIELFLKGVDCPRSLTVWLLYKYKEHDQLVRLGWKAESYANSSAARDAYISTEFLRKAEFLTLSTDPREVAIAGFLEAEESCRRTNDRFLHPALDPEFSGPNVWLLHRTRRLVSRLLGGQLSATGHETSSFDFREWFESCNWGPGSNFGHRGVKTAPAYKFQSQTGITEELYDVVRKAFPLSYPLWDRQLRKVSPFWGAEWSDGTMCTWGYSPHDDLVNVRLENCCLEADRSNSDPVRRTYTDEIEEILQAYKWKGACNSGCFDRGNRILTVRKNAKTDRVIAAEPSLNSWFQLGLGTMISRRLLRFGGIDLRQQARNQLLAFYGSYTGNLATVDFSAASDTISTEVVRYLLPYEWFRVMNACRSVLGRDPRGNGWMRYEKFASMGNGFTFPLQSLIFCAAAIACCEYVGTDSNYVGVYGDDVVLPSEVFSLYSEFCSFLGFKVGPEKSFSSGFFRESCGGHYLRGVDLKPIYLKERLGCRADIYVLANNIRRLAHRFCFYGCSGRFRASWRYLFSQIPPAYRFIVPEGSGDGGFVGNFDEARPKTVRIPQIRAGGQKLPLTWVEGYQVRMVVQQPVEDEVNRDGLRLSRYLDVDRRHALAYEEHGSPYSEDLAGGGNRVPRRRAKSSFVKWVDVPKPWYNFGPWY